MEHSTAMASKGDMVPMMHMRIAGCRLAQWCPRSRRSREMVWFQCKQPEARRCAHIANRQQESLDAKIECAQAVVITFRRAHPRRTEAQLRRFRNCLDLGVAAFKLAPKSVVMQEHNESFVIKATLLKLRAT